MTQLSKHLQLNSIQENKIIGNKLTAVVCYFTFFGIEGEAYITIRNLEKEHPSYAMTEITSELSESFNELLADEDIWKIISGKVKEFIQEWEQENAEENG